MKRIILHVDVNNAFLSWSAVDRLRRGESVDIRGRYAVIGGDEKERRGIVLAKSDLCKRQGVVTGEALFMARRKCPYLEVYPADYQVYREFSDKMYEYLLNYTNVIERYSIDECFLDYTYSVKLFGNPIKMGYKIKEDIKRKFGFTVNVGIGNNKLEAKMASDFSKPDKVHTLFDEEIREKMWPLAIDDLFMLGKASAKKLHEMGIQTIGELAGMDEKLLVDIFKSHGKLMWEEANGIDESEVKYQERIAKSISASTVLSYNYSDLGECLRVIRKLVMEVGRKLRGKGRYAMNVSIWIKYSNFVKVSKQVNLGKAIRTDEDIYEVAKGLFEGLWKREEYIRGLGVGVGNLTDVAREEKCQLSLFDRGEFREEKRDKDCKGDKLQGVIDEIREKYGDDKIMYADMMGKRDEKGN